MKFNVAVIKGDGIGPEIVDEAIKVLEAVGKKYGHEFAYTEALAGGCSIETHGIPLTQETIDICKSSDAILLGAVGGPKWDNLPGYLRAEKAILGLRSELGLFANLRPALMFDSLSDACPLKPELVEGGLDVLIVRELTGGVYFGERGRKFTEDMGEMAYDVMPYTEKEIERIGRVAFEMAMKRNKKVTSVDKSNVLETSRLWRSVMHNIKDDYPEVEYEDLFVDNTAMQLVINPKQFDVIVTENMFGDILSDEASMITGSIGMLPSASFGEGTRGLYEPVHGSAPDIAGKGIANPLATILSVAMMLKYSFGLLEEAVAVEDAVKAVLEDGWRTADIAKKGEKALSTQEMGAKVIEKLQ
ncbi:MAG: 3-isopropylmalate dehydrogenase [Firmicutes bacterium]|nr:3-isopropylmalate dehydrogenase [Bacillota bacterium]